MRSRAKPESQLRLGLRPRFKKMDSKNLTLDSQSKAMPGLYPVIDQ
jgi:hypothetical protein